MTNNGEIVLLSVMGSHAGETEDEIFRRKMADIASCKKTFWLTHSVTAKPEFIQEVCTHALRYQSYVNCIFITARKPTQDTISTARAIAFSRDKQEWERFPSSLSPVTGKIDAGASALVFDGLDFASGKLDLWDYVQYGTEDVPLTIRQRMSTFPCVRSSIPIEGLVKSRERRVIAVGRLVTPFCVWLKSEDSSS
jgi:hypothetical protein